MDFGWISSKGDTSSSLFHMSCVMEIYSDCVTTNRKKRRELSGLLHPAFICKRPFFDWEFDSHMLS